MRQSPLHATWPLPRAVARPGAQARIDNLPINGPDQFSLTRDFMTMSRIGVMQEFTRSEKRQCAPAFRARSGKSVAEKAVTIASIQRDTALAWLDRYTLRPWRR